MKLIKSDVIFVHGLGPSGDFYERDSVAEYGSTRCLNYIVYKRERGMLMQERAEKLAEFLEARYGGEGAPNFHLIGHSAGGIDSVFALTFVSKVVASRCISVTSMGSPFGGSPIAEMVLDPRCDLKMNALNWLAREIVSLDFVREMTPTHMNSLAIIRKPGIEYAYIPCTMQRHKAHKIFRDNYDLMAERGYFYSDGTVPLVNQGFGKQLEHFEANHTAQMTSIYPFGKYGWFPWSRVWKNIWSYYFDYLLKLES